MSERDVKLRDNRYLIELSENEINTLTYVLADATADDKAYPRLVNLRNVVQKAREVGGRGGSISFPSDVFSDIMMASEVTGLSISRTVEHLINSFLDKANKQ